MKRYLSKTLVLLCVCFALLFSSFTTAYASVAELSDNSQIYEEKSGLVCAPTVLLQVNEAEDLQVAEGKAPSILILSVDDGLNVLSSNGSVISSLGEAFTTVAKKCAVAVKIESHTAADAFLSFCKDNSVLDVYAISSDVEILNSLSGYKYLIKILDIRGKSLGFEQVVENTVMGGSRIVLSSKQTFTYGQNRKLKALQIYSWTEADTEEEVFGAMYDNYTGVLTPDASVAYGAYSKITETTLCDSSVAVGHRGSSGAYPENSVEAARYAVDCGAEAIEYDIHITADNKIVIMHDDDISTTTNGTGKVSEMTLDQIRQYQLVGYGKTVEIPTLEDMLNEFKDEDVVHYVEYKADSTAMVPYVKAILDKVGMRGKVVFLSFFSNVLEESQRLMPEIPVGQLWGYYDTRDYYDSVNTALEKFYSVNKTNHCAYTYLYRQYVQAARHRGIMVNGYTFVGESWYRYYLYDMGTLTLDNPEGLKVLPKRVSAEDINCYVGEPVVASGKITTPEGEKEVTCSVIILEGGEAFEVGENGVSPVKAGTYTAVLSYEHEGDYSVLSNVVKINVSQKASDGGDTGENKGCSGNIYGTAFLGCLALAAFAIIKTKVNYKREI